MSRNTSSSQSRRFSRRDTSSSIGWTVPQSRNGWEPPTQRENGLLLRSPASRRYPDECTDYGEESTQNDNKSARVRSAHLQWLRENDVYTLGNMNRWRGDMRVYRPSSSARYPIKMSIPKMLRDPEWLPDDFKVHVYHGKSDRAFVRDWIRGILEVRRFSLTTGPLSAPCSNQVKKIIIIVSEKMLKKDFHPACLTNAWEKLVLVIKRDNCCIPDEVEAACTAHIDLSAKCMHDFALQTPLMSAVFNALDLPVSVCSA